MTQGTLGHIVSWRVPSSVPLATLREALAKAGLPADMAQDLHPRRVLGRALRDMREGRVICQFSKEGKTVRFQLTRQIVESAGVEYVREAVVSLDLDTGEVSADDPKIGERARQLVAEHAGKRLTNDLTRMLQRIYDSESAALVPIREQGGAYFVPAEHAALVEQSRIFLRAIGGKLNSFAVRLGCTDTAESVADSMAEYMQSLVAAFKDSCASITSASRKDTVERRYEAISEMRTKLECYRGLLLGHAGAISEAIAAAERDLVAAIARAPEAGA